MLHYDIESWKRNYTDHWMKGKKRHLEWDLVEYRYALSSTVKLSHNPQAHSKTLTNGIAILSLFCYLLITYYDSQV